QRGGGEIARIGHRGRRRQCRGGRGAAARGKPDGTHLGRPRRARRTPAARERHGRGRTVIRSVFKGSGSALPSKLLTNDELATLVDTSDEWIRERTGITGRYIAEDGETTGSLATDAARAALADAGIAPSEVDLIVLAT